MQINPIGFRTQTNQMTTSKQKNVSSTTFGAIFSDSTWENLNSVRKLLTRDGDIVFTNLMQKAVENIKTTRNDMVLDAGIDHFNHETLCPRLYKNKGENTFLQLYGCFPRMTHKEFIAEHNRWVFSSSVYVKKDFASQFIHDCFLRLKFLASPEGRTRILDAETSLQKQIDLRNEKAAKEAAEAKADEKNAQIRNAFWKNKG